MSGPLLHIAAFWIDSDRGDELADFCAELKLEGSRGAVVTFSEAVADEASFRHVMERLDLAEVNDRAGRGAVT